jgi:hypothetical protein
LEKKDILNSIRQITFWNFYITNVY